MDVFEVFECDKTRRLHAIPEKELQFHMLHTDCPCKTVIEIYTYRNGGRLIERHQKVRR